MKIAIIGGGISGVVSAVKLSKDLPDCDIDLYEKKQSLLNGPPYCHLHAGGFLYPEMPLADCKELMLDSIEFANMFPDAIIHRPTVIAFNKHSSYNPHVLNHKCFHLSRTYALAGTTPLGETHLFYAMYSYEDAVYFKKHGHFYKTADKARRYHDTFVSQFLNLLTDINSIKYPFACVNEPGIDQQKVVDYCLELLKESRVKLHLATDIKSHDIHNVSKTWYIKDSRYDALVNAAGHASRDVFPNVSMVEFKSSFVIQNSLDQLLLPEIAIIGKRQTENGLLQITPIGNNEFQLHSMTTDSSIITTASSHVSNLVFDAHQRTAKALERIIAFMPSFDSSVILNKALSGVQRISNEASLEKRVSQIICDPSKNYAELQTIKASSAVSLSHKVSKFFASLKTTLHNNQ